MTFIEILNQIGQRAGYSLPLPPTVQTRLLGFLNIRHRQVLTKLTKLRDSGSPLTLTTVSGQQRYSLPSVVTKIKTIYDPLTNNRKLDERSLQWVRSVDPRAQNVSFGPPRYWIDYGIRPVQKDIPAATKLYVSSDGATDNCTVTVEYIRTGGHLGGATVALTNTTPVQLGTANDIIEVTKLYLGATALGFVSLTTNATNGTVLSTLAPGETFARYKSILLYPTPSSSNLVLSIDYVRNIPDPTVNPNDEPLIPLDFQWILIPGTLMDHWTKTDDGRYSPAKAEYAEGYKALESDILNNDDLLIIPGGEREPAPYPFKLPAGI